MSLPWFPFNIKDFLANTKRLNTEAKGAYLCLMLDYYEQEGPAPDDDDVLAAICELPVDAWIRHRKVIAPLFQISDGLWRHDRIEREIESGSTKLAQSKARAQAGAAAMHLKRGHKLASSKPQASLEPAKSNIPTSSQLEAVPKQSLETAPLTLTKEESLSVSVLTVDKENSGDNSAHRQNPPDAGEGFVDAAFPQNSGHFPQNSDEDGVGTPIDPQFWPCENHITVCNIDGAESETIRREVAGFIATHQERGTFSHDWDASWTMWWKRWKDHRDALAAKKPKPRVEVSSKFDPTAEQWTAECVKFASNASLWSRQYGPEPGQARCRCPPRILLMAGIDPATGLKISAALIDMKLAALEPEKI